MSSTTHVQLLQWPHGKQQLQHKGAWNNNSLEQASSKLEETVIRLKERQAETLAEISKVGSIYCMSKKSCPFLYKEHTIGEDFSDILYLLVVVHTVTYLMFSRMNVRICLV